jgi:hypothetical protein
MSKACGSLAPKKSIFEYNVNLTNYGQNKAQK